jgi:type IV pilus assembly protein PilV
MSVTDLQLTAVRRLYPRQTGVGMIEVLVALLIISVGFLNIAALQTTAKKSNFDSLQRTSAVILAKDIVEKMRANPVELNSYLTDGDGVGGGTLSEPGTACTTAARCTTGQLAAYDMWLWEQAMDGMSESRDIDGTNTNTGGLVNPTGCITGPAGGAAGVYTITIVWRGLNELTNVSADLCGVGSGKYGANEEYRRISVLSTYISP